jgi:hypothetical protein
MPRINRFAVVFPDRQGQLWQATFHHSHNDEKGIETLIDGKWVRGRHITECILSIVGKTTGAVSATSLCSMKDQYNWKKGLKQSLMRAFEKAGIHAGTEEFGDMMANFYRELPIKAYPPHVAAVEIPPENRAGLGYAGMD